MADVTFGKQPAQGFGGVRILGRCGECDQETESIGSSFYIPPDAHDDLPCFIFTFECPCGHRWGKRLYC